VALARKLRGYCGERGAVSAKVEEVTEGLAWQKPPLPIAALSRHAAVARCARYVGVD
jgi:hypothetical protein